MPQDDNPTAHKLSFELDGQPSRFVPSNRPPHIPRIGGDAVDQILRLLRERVLVATVAWALSEKGLDISSTTALGNRLSVTLAKRSLKSGEPKSLPLLITAFPALAFVKIDVDHFGSKPK
jgi:hypothetical protein